MGVYSRIRKKTPKKIVLCFLVIICALAIALSFGLRSYANAAFNPDVQINVLNSDGLVETNPNFNEKQPYYKLQLSAVLPSVQQVNNESNATGYAISAVASGGVSELNLGIGQTWMGYDLAPEFAGMNISTASSNSNPNVGLLEQMYQGNLEGVQMTGTSSPVYWGTQWTLTLTSAFITFLEQNGYKAATASSPQSSSPGLQPGERFGIVFYAKISANSSGKKDALTAWAGWPSFSGQAPSSWAGASTDTLDMGAKALTNESHLNIELGEIKSGLFDDKQKIEVQPGTPIDFQAVATLPDPSSLTGSSSYFSFELIPSLGISLTNLGQVKVAGLPLSSLPSGWKVQPSSESESVEGDKFAYWILELTAADIEEIEKAGFSPATASSPQSSSPKIAVGSPFALTFTGELNSSATQETILKARVGLMQDSGNWTLTSSQDAQLSFTPTGQQESIPEDLSFNFLNSQGLVDTSNPHYYMTSLESPSDPSKMIVSRLGVHKFQITLPLPNPSQMAKDNSVLVIKNIPGAGLAVENPDYIQNDRAYIGDITIAGMPLSIFREVYALYTNLPFTTSPSDSKNPMIEGTSDGSNYWELILTPSEIEEIEQKGVSAATSASPQGKAAGLAPGDKFAITFSGFVTSAASGDVTDEAQVGWASESQTSSQSSSSASSTPSKSVEIKNFSPSSSQTLTLVPQTLQVYPAANLSMVNHGYLNQYPYAGIGTPMQFQLSSALPNPSQMSGQWANFDLYDIPLTGVSVENPKEAASDFELAGLPLLSIPGIQISSSSQEEWIEGDESGQESFEVDLTRQSVEYIEKNGLAPATRSATQATKPGIDPGSLFALTFPGELNSSAVSYQGNCRDTAYSQYEGDKNGETITKKSTLASLGIKYNGISTPLTAQLNVVNQSTGLLERNPVYTPGESIEFQLTLTLPNPDSLSNTAQAAKSISVPGWYGIQIAPGKGVDVQTYISPTVTVAGLQYQYGSLINDSTVFGGLSPQEQEEGQQYISGTASNSPTISSDDSSYWGLAFNSAGIKYIEENGQIPATFTSKAYWPSGGLKPGDKFAIIFYGQLNSDASTSNPLYAFAGYESNSPGDPQRSSGWWTESDGQWGLSKPTVNFHKGWQYQLSSYKATSVYISNFQMSSPTDTLQVVKDGKPQSTPSYPQNAPIDFRITSSLPEASKMVGNYGYYRLEIDPKSGVSVYNGSLAENAAYFTIGGKPLTSIPGVKVLSSSNSPELKGGQSLTVAFSPASLSYITSNDLAPSGNLEVDFVGFLNQNASFKANSNQISSTSSFSSSPLGEYSVQSNSSEVSIQEEKEAVHNLPLTGGKGVVLILLLSLVIILMSAAGMVLAKKRMKKG